MGQCVVKNEKGAVLRQASSHHGHNGAALGLGQESKSNPEPQFLQLMDRFGNSLCFSNGGDVLLAPSHWVPDARQRLADVKQMKIRQDDVLIAGFMKSGNHWVQQICRMLLQGSTEYTPNTLTYEVLEYIPPDKITPPDKPRVFFTHLRFHHLPKQVLEKKIKLIYLLRNPKDTFVSLYCHLSKMTVTMAYSGTWDHFFSHMLDMGFYHGDWFDHVLDWESQLACHPELPAFVLQYEDLKRDTLGYIQKLNKFLGLNRSDELCEAIAQAVDIKSMQEKEEVMMRALDIFQKDSPGVYRKGEIGDWKNWFTPAQNQRFEEVFKRRMANSKRTFTFE